MPNDARSSLSRRQFATLAGTAGAALALPGAARVALAQTAAKPNPADIIHGISPEMIIHNG